jgi:hypothetical protein
MPTASSLSRSGISCPRVSNCSISTICRPWPSSSKSSARRLGPGSFSTARNRFLTRPSDWLLDIRLRSRSFHADNASILLEDLGLTSQQLRAHFKERTKFLKSRDRVDRLKRWVTPNDAAGDLDRKMIAVLARAEQPDLSGILLRLFSALVQDDVANLDAEPKVWSDIVANVLMDSFWVLVEQEMGYRDAAPTLRDLLFRILVTDFSRTVSGACPAQLSHFILNDKARAANASVFVAGWRSHMQHFGSYDALSGKVARELGLTAVIAGLPAESLAESMTFEEVERRIIQDLKDRIIAGAGADMDSLRGLIARRRDGHWANKLLAHSSAATRAWRHVTTRWKRQPASSS